MSDLGCIIKLFSETLDALEQVRISFKTQSSGHKKSPRVNQTLRLSTCKVL